MQRRIGTAKLGGLDADIQIEGTFDARQYLRSYAELLSFKPEDKIPNRFFVSVFDANEALAGQYECIDNTKIGNPDPLIVASAWRKVGGLDASGAQVGQLPVKGAQGWLFKFAYELETTAAFPITYLQARQLMTNTPDQPKLIVGKSYQIIDFETIHIIKESNHLNVGGHVFQNKADWQGGVSVGVVEPLVLLAVTDSSFSGMAYSPLHPTDIIEYDIFNDKCEDNITPRRGWITKRRIQQNRVDCDFDVRRLLNIRYRINPPAYDVNASYNVNQVVFHNNGLYGCLVQGTQGVEPTKNTDNYNWIWLYDMNAGVLNWHIGIKGSNFAIGGLSVPVDTTQYKYYHTFCVLTSPTTEDAVPDYHLTLVVDNKIGLAVNGGLPNVVCCSQYSSGARGAAMRYITIPGRSRDFTLTGSCSNLNFGEANYEFIVRSVVNSSFDVFCHAMLLTSNVSGNQLGRFYPQCNNIVFHGGTANTFHQSVSRVYLKGAFNGNIVAQQSSFVSHGSVNNMRMLAKVTGVVFQNHVSDITILQPIQNITFASLLLRATFDISLISATGSIPSVISETIVEISISDLYGGNSRRETEINAGGEVDNLVLDTNTARFTSSNQVILKGVSEPSNGREITIINHTPFVLIIQHQTGTIAANQFMGVSGANIEIPVDRTARFLYLPSVQKWVYIN